MKNFSILSMLTCSVASVLAQYAPPICMLTPLAMISAGQAITASIDNPYDTPCTATMIFSDENFLPVAFELEPLTCLGYQYGSIVVPQQAPNGEVTIIWRCAGETLSGCSRAMITGGSADLDAIDQQQTGIVECLVATATITTLITSTQGTTDVVNAVVSTLFSTSVSPTTVNLPDTGTATLGTGTTTLGTGTTTLVTPTALMTTIMVTPTAMTTTLMTGDAGIPVVTAEIITAAGS